MYERRGCKAVAARRWDQRHQCSPPGEYFGSVRVFDTADWKNLDLVLIIKQGDGGFRYEDLY